MSSLPIAAVAVSLVWLTTPSQALAAPDAVRVARYTEIIGPSSAERDPLAVVASLRFPRETVVTIGDALGYLLQRAGFTLAAGDAAAQHLFGLPLPESQRQIGPHPVGTLAGLLAGEGFRVEVDRRTRVLSVIAVDTANPGEQP